MTVQTRNFDQVSRRLKYLGLGGCVLFFGLTIASSFVIKIEGAVISQSEVISTGNNKTVQHRDGGIIKRLLVKNGDYIEQGAAVLVLDGQAIEAEFTVLRFRQIELQAKIARLNDTLSGRSDYGFHPIRSVKYDTILPETHAQKTRIKQAVQTQKDLFYASRNQFNSNLQSLEGRHAFYRDELTALSTQIKTTEQQMGVIHEQLREIAPLVVEKLVARSKKWSLNRDLINVQTQMDALNVQRIKTQSAMSETQHEISKLNTSQKQNLLDALELAQTELQSVEQSYHSLGEKLSRLVVKAPVSGMVHDLQFHNAQAVLRAGETIMEIVPQNSGHELQARIKPVDIDQVKFGQQVRLRFEAFDADNTPELFGTVKDISADSFTDPNTGMAYYEVAIAMNQEQRDRLGDKKIVPGMPATAMFRTVDRSLFSYLTQPIEQQTARAFH